MRLSVVVLAILLAVPALAAAAPADGEPVLVDDVGDAQDGEARKTAAEMCGSPVRSCLQNLVPGEAHPTLDLVSATFVETPTTLEIVLGLAEVREDFSAALGPEADDEAVSVEYILCWGSGDLEWATSCAALDLVRRSGNVSAKAAYVVFSYEVDECFASFCAWNVPYRVEPGSPGSLVVEVPRVLLPNGTAGSTFHSIVAQVFKAAAKEAYDPMEVREGVLGAYNRVNPPEGGWTVDIAYDEGATYTLLTPMTEHPLPWAPAVDGSATARGERADVDVVSVDLVDDPRSFTFAVEVARVDEVPAPDLGFWLAMGNAGDDAINAGFMISEGTYAPWAGWCPRSDCDDIEEDWHERDVVLHVEPGEPGWFNLTFDKRTFNLTDGDLLAYARGEMFTPRREDAQVQHGLPVIARSYGTWDGTGYMPPYRIGSNARTTVLDELPPSADLPGIVFSDPAGDVVLARATAPVPLPVDPYGADPAQFDVLGVRAEATSDRDTRITLSVADLRSIQVPKDFDAVAYAVGVATPDGQFMVGFMKQGGNTPTAPPTQQFFCGQDTAVFQETRADPLSVVLTDIQGIISVAGGNATGGSGGRGSIVFYVPNECFARDTPGPLTVDRLAAGSYLIQRSSGQVTAADETEGDYGGILQVASAPVAQPRFIDAPLGIPWDVWGIAAAVLTSAGGVLLVARRRSMLKRYLAEVERADEGGLVAIRGRLKRDLVRGAISEGHFSIVERRLDERLANSRIAGLKEAFHELPMRLLERLQGMLADGRMSAEDHRVFMALLVDAPLTEEAKARVRTKLEGWVRKDA